MNDLRFFHDLPFAHEMSVALQATREAGATARQMQGAIAATAKADGSPVTPGDLAADAIISHYLTQHFPADAILSEEQADSPARLTNERLWIIDPIDGTTNFVHAYPGSCVSIALVQFGAKSDNVKRLMTLLFI